eukprot:TRINITY_DN2940_c0_g3_i1.p3 TRINITY_DN2940_c0_g3~~TRINITY_DN2940_c0_g3_i1.p3  ORF type:complete len:140 (+),score=26.86 TRINITY_DN2940_c0_g3_i1:296-715(+)
MKQSALLLGALAMLFMSASTGLAGKSGEEIFKSMACGACHKMEESSKVNPSVAKIAEAYQGKKQQLVDYLNGESEPIVDAGKANLMKSSLRRTKELPEEERAALAEYMLSAQQPYLSAFAPRCSREQRVFYWPGAQSEA